MFTSIVATLYNVNLRNSVRICSHEVYLVAEGNVVYKVQKFHVSNCHIWIFVEKQIFRWSSPPNTMPVCVCVCVHRLL